MKIIKHVLEQPFVAATGAAALVHSTWALATLFAGEQPGSLLALVGWLAPALLISFALDVGQIATSIEIRQHGMTFQRGVTFFVFAIATYYLQWLYIAHHMPALALADGVRASWGDFATIMRDAAVWVIPGLLPLSTLLYTFSTPNHAPAAPTTVQIEPVEPVAQLPEGIHSDGDTFTVICPDCGWTKHYDNPDSAGRGLRTHQLKHCTGNVIRSSNGHHVEVLNES